ncbi:MAG: HAD family phosphatase [Acetobacteraceae bacterium]|nr:HAD family phosphatase [Acetobacteraceae bacterium]
MSARPDIKLLLADVDGTLVTQDKLITEGASKAAEALRKAGIGFAVTSGRPPRGMAMLIEPLHITTMIAGFNGGVYTDDDLKVLETKTLPPDAAREALQILLDGKLDAWLYTGEDWFIHKGDAPHVAREAWTVKFDAKIVPEFSDELLDNVVKLVGVSDDHALVEKVEKTAQEKLGQHASAARSQPYYLDITHPDANKGAVVGRLSQMLSIPPENIATIGDGANDVLMFKKSGFSIAMGNASDAVKQGASAVTDSNEQEGFAKAVHRYILGEG